MDASSPQGEQELGGDEDDEGKENNRSPGPASSVLRSSSPISTQYTKLRRKCQRMKKCLPCFFKKRSLVDKATSTSDLFNEVKDEHRSLDHQDQREKTFLTDSSYSLAGFSPPGGDDMEIKLSKCNWITSPLKRRSPLLDQTPPGEHSHWDSPPGSEGLAYRAEKPQRHPPRRLHREAFRRDRGKSPSRESPGEESSAKRKRSPGLKKSPGDKSPRWKRLRGSRDTSPRRDEPVIRDTRRRSHKEVPHRDSGKSPDRKLSGRERSPHLRLPLWKARGLDTSPRRDESVTRDQSRRPHSETSRRDSETSRRDSEKSPDRKLLGGERLRSPGDKSSRWRRPRGPRDTSPRRDESVTRHTPYDERKPAPLRHSASSRRHDKKYRRSEMSPVKKSVKSITVVGLLCFLLAALTLFAAVKALPVCVGKVSWAVMPREALLLELVSVSLLVIATTSILLLVDGLHGIITELVIAAILVLYNASLVHLVRCLCFIPGRCLWLAALVAPLFLITLFVLCRQKMALLWQPS